MTINPKALRTTVVAQNYMYLYSDSSGVKGVNCSYLVKDILIGCRETSSRTSFYKNSTRCIKLKCQSLIKGIQTFSLRN